MLRSQRAATTVALAVAVAVAVAAASLWSSIPETKPKLRLISKMPMHQRPERERESRTEKDNCRARVEHMAVERAWSRLPSTIYACHMGSTVKNRQTKIDNSRQKSFFKRVETVTWESLVSQPARICHDLVYFRAARDK